MDNKTMIQVLEILKAHQLTRHPIYRQPLDSQLALLYKEDSRLREELSGYREMPLIRVLEQWGEKAQVRYLQTEGFGRTKAGHDVVYPKYTVTHADGGDQNPFTARLKLHRVTLEAGGANWYVDDARSNLQPEE